MKNKGKENPNRERETVDKDSIKKLIRILALSAPLVGEEGGVTGALAIAARVPPAALTIFKMKVRSQFLQTVPSTSCGRGKPVRGLHR